MAKTKQEVIDALKDLHKDLLRIAPADCVPNERLISGEISNAIAMVMDSDKDEWK
jgi:hypothetical protein